MKSRLVCVINNFNYERFLGPCLDSALGQTRKFDLIVVVDDGSHDGSRELIDSYRDGHDNIVAVYKPNGGQLSCFNAAVQFVEDGDLVFFLDADDVYPANYVAELSTVAAVEKADFYFCKAVRFEDGQEPLNDAVISSDGPVVLPLTSALTLATGRWLGAETSALAVSGRLYRQILPYPFEYDWVVRADDVIVFAASILGAKKVFIPSLGIGYRIHGKNLFTGNDMWRETRQKLLREFRVERLFTLYGAQAGVRRNPGCREIDRELQLFDETARGHFRFSPAASLFRKKIRKRIKQFLKGRFCS